MEARRRSEARAEGGIGTVKSGAQEVPRSTRDGRDEVSGWVRSGREYEYRQMYSNDEHSWKDARYLDRICVPCTRAREEEEKEEAKRGERA